MQLKIPHNEPFAPHNHLNHGSWLVIKLAEVKQFLIDNSTKNKAENQSQYDDEEVVFTVNSSQQSWEHDDFVPFEDDEDENARYENARFDPAKHDIEDEFLPQDFFDDMYDE